MYAGMTNSERDALEKVILARRAAKASGALAKIPQAKRPHDKGEGRTIKPSNYCRSGQNPADFAKSKAS